MGVEMEQTMESERQRVGVCVSVCVYSIFDG